MAKFHTSIGSPRALCGRDSTRHWVISNTDFARSSPECRCRQCAKLYAKRGYHLASSSPARIVRHAATYASHTAEAA